VAVKVKLNNIICGDLNSKSTTWGCQEDNVNGKILSELVSNASASTMNNKDTTHRFNAGIKGEYSESIIDMFIISGDLLDKTVSFRVNKRHNYFGHFSITASFDIPATRIANKPTSTGQRLPTGKYLKQQPRRKSTSTSTPTALQKKDRGLCLITMSHYAK